MQPVIHRAAVPQRTDDDAEDEEDVRRTVSAAVKKK